MKIDQEPLKIVDYKVGKSDEKNEKNVENWWKLNQRMKKIIEKLLKIG